MAESNKGFWYLASPYTHIDTEVRARRFRAAVAAAGQLLKTGIICYSPIAHNVPLETQCGLPGTWNFWEPVCEAFVLSSRGVLVLQLEGWDTSKGVTAEIGMAKQAGLPIYFLPVSELDAICEESLTCLA